jgi:hypothetical protein
MEAMEATAACLVALGVMGRDPMFIIRKTPP